MLKGFGDVLLTVMLSPGERASTLSCETPRTKKVSSSSPGDTERLVTITPDGPFGVTTIYSFLPSPWDWK